MNGRTVLLLTHQLDFAADRIVLGLNERDVDVVRLDLGCYPRAATLTARLDSDPATCLTTLTPMVGKPVNLSNLSSIWYGHPGDPSLDPGLDPDAADFALAESLQALAGLLRTAECEWVNHPEKVVSGSYKPYQLALAARLGLRIPRTLITNDPAKIREFAGSNKGGTIYKTLSIPRIASETYHTSLIFTSMLSDADLEAVASVRYAPCLLQEFIPKAFEVRITVIGEQVFCVAMHAPDHDTVVDWRPVTDELRYEIYQLPQRVSDQCVSMVRALGLTYGAIDMVVTPENDYVFLEVNPSGQFVWLEMETGIPIMDALLDRLAPFSATRSRASV